ncbi:MAG: hypothetical protein M1167_07885, partial [Chloroflexi bacterium]|nr:hypothetical protein [Chloroflexota bacterium]
MKKMFESKPKNHKEHPENETFHIDYVGGQNFEDADCIFGIVNITKDISAAVIRLYPAGTLNEMRSGKAIKLTCEKKAIIEISTEAKYDYKELGMWSKWPEPRTIHYSECAPVSLTIPRRADKLGLVQLAEKNLESALDVD